MSLQGQSLDSAVQALQRATAVAKARMSRPIRDDSPTSAGRALDGLAAVLGARLGMAAEAQGRLANRLALMVGGSTERCVLTIVVWRFVSSSPWGVVEVVRARTMLVPAVDSVGPYARDPERFSTIAQPRSSVAVEAGVTCLWLHATWPPA